MKKLCCLFLVLALILPISVPAVAAENTAADTATYVEAETGDTITLEAIEVTAAVASRKNVSPGVYATRIFRNDSLEELLYVDFSNNILRHEYPDGTVITEVLSDIVTVTTVKPSADDQVPEVLSTVSQTGTPRIDYVDSEHFNITSSGVQESLSGASTHFGYQAMGYRGGYYYAPTTFGYLQRRNDGVVGTYETHLFSFAAGTTISTAASIIVAFFNSKNIVDLVLSVAASLLSPIVDVVTYDWSAQFEVKCYKWHYRVRLNSDTGNIIYTNYRIRHYWKSYNLATGAASYRYRGAAFDEGFVLSNSEMIKFGIDSYLENLN